MQLNAFRNLSGPLELPNQLFSFLTTIQSQTLYLIKLFNMETTVEKLEAMFQKSEADLDYLERRLKLDFINSTAENGSSAEENPAVMLENLKAVKAKYSLLCSEVKDIANAQKESMEGIRTSLSGIMEVIKHCQETSDAEVVSLTELEQEAAALLGAAANSPKTEVSPSEAAQGQQPQSSKR
ncbi:SKA complex subunit 2 isoform X2 [Oryzias latipes]